MNYCHLFGVRTSPRLGIEVLKFRQTDPPKDKSIPANEVEYTKKMVLEWMRIPLFSLAINTNLVLKRYEDPLKIVSAFIGQWKDKSKPKG